MRRVALRADAERSVACGCGQRAKDFYLLALRSVEYEPGYSFIYFNQLSNYAYTLCPSISTNISPNTYIALIGLHSARTAKTSFGMLAINSKFAALILNFLGSAKCWN